MAPALNFLILCGDEKSVYVPTYEVLLKQTRHHCVGLAVVPFIPPSRKEKFYRFLFQLYGPGGFLRKSLKVLLKKISSPTFEHLARKYQFPVKRFSNPNSPACLEWIAQCKPDVILASQPFKIKNPLLTLPAYGILNKHAALLPFYRGVYPVFWAMLQGEKNFGLSIHRMEEAYDAGAIYAQKTFPLDLQRSFEENYAAVSGAIPAAFEEAMNYLVDPDFKPRSHSAHEGTYFGYPERVEIQAFKKKGLRVF